MRHRSNYNRLGRQSAHRKAVLQNIVKSFLVKEQITTTLTMAKEARRLAERMITLGKSDTLAARRQAYRVLNDHELVHVLFSDVAPRFVKRAGGYTRIVHLPKPRRGDAAAMAILEMTERTPKAVKTETKKSLKKTKAPEPGAPVVAEAVGEKEMEKKGFFKGLKTFLKKEPGE
ncbi:MAG: 50S ribosomal protein L17 [Candidatus Omnitrophica bacterium]|nr:50S ribosomal protein L17 [Candidatus Omnitrophota bacterium]